MMQKNTLLTLENNVIFKKLLPETLKREETEPHRSYSGLLKVMQLVSDKVKNTGHGISQCP